MIKRPPYKKKFVKNFVPFLDLLYWVGIFNLDFFMYF